MSWYIRINYTLVRLPRRVGSCLLLREVLQLWQQCLRGDIKHTRIIKGIIGIIQKEAAITKRDGPYYLVYVVTPSQYDIITLESVRMSSRYFRRTSTFRCVDLLSHPFNQPPIFVASKTRRECKSLRSLILISIHVQTVTVLNLSI